MKKFNLSKGLLVGLLTLALCFTMFGVVKASAEESSSSSGSSTAAEVTAVTVTYNAETNKLEASTAFTAYYLKKDGDALKKGKAVGKAAAKNETTNIYELDVSSMVKGTTKDAYFYVVSGSITADVDAATANMVIKAQAAKKIVGAIDYTKVDYNCVSGVLNATATDADKTTLTGYKLLWSDKQDSGFALANFSDSDKCTTTLAADIEADPAKYFNTDGTVKTVSQYFDLAEGVNPTDAQIEKYNDDIPEAMQNALSGGYVASKLKSGATIYVKMLGESGGNGTAQFSSKAVKVKIAKQAKAPSLKLDVKKEVYALKNGFDFAAAELDDQTYTIDTWYTILPVLKDASTTLAADSIVATSKFLPQSKKNDDAKEVYSTTHTHVSFTTYKFKNVSYTDLTEGISATGAANAYPGIGDDFGYLAVRKSATEKKPASAVFYAKFNKKTEAPLVFTAERVSGETLVKTLGKSEDFEKKGYVLSGLTVKNYPGMIYAESGEGTGIASGSGELATEGYYDTFKILTSAASGQILKDADTAATSYEFMIVSKSDYENNKIDWSTATWKALNAKAKINSKTKGKYTDTDGSKQTPVLEVASSRSAATSLILIRRVAIKGKTMAASTVGSKPVALCLVANGENVDLHIWDVDQTVGDEAFKYAIQFATWTGSTSGTGTNATTVYDWKVNNAYAPINVWFAKSGSGDETKYVSFTDLKKNNVTYGVYYKGECDASGEITLPESASSGVRTAVASGDNEGKYELKVTDAMRETYASTGFTETVIVREYANVIVQAVYGTVSGEGTSGEFTAVAGNAGTRTIAKIENGKVYSYSAGSGFTVADNVPANQFVGEDLEISLETAVSGGLTAPAGYLWKEGAQPEGYPEVIVAAGFETEPDEFTDGTLNVRMDTASATTISINYAVDESKAFTVTFNGNKPSGATGDVNLSISGEATTNERTGKLPESAISGTPTLTGYKFLKWTKDQSGSGEAIKAGTANDATIFTEDTTVYAQWEKQSKVTFMNDVDVSDADGGEIEYGSYVDKDTVLKIKVIVGEYLDGSIFDVTINGELIGTLTIDQGESPEVDYTANGDDIYIEMKLK